MGLGTNSRDLWVRRKKLARMREIDILDPALTLRFKVDRKVGTNKRFWYE